MSFKFNPFTGTFDIAGSSAVSSWKAPVADIASLPASGNSDGDVRIALDVNDAYQWDSGSSAWLFLGKIKAGAFGSTPNTKGLSIGADNTLTLQPANATNPGAVTTGTQTLAGDKTLTGVLYASGGVDVPVTAGVDTLSIGTGNAEVINIGTPSAIVNIIGSVNNNLVTNLNVKDSLITINDGGGVGSGAGAGFEVEENNIATAYVKTSGDRNNWSLKAPNTAGEALIVPGASGITLNQSSHNPVTVTDSNSIDLTLTVQDLTASLIIADATLETTGSGVRVGQGALTNVNISSSAGIVYSKLSLTNSIVNADIATAAAIAYSKLSLTASVVNADIAVGAAIAYSKLALSNSIVNADVASGAAIALNKLATTTSNRALVSNGSGVITPSTTTDTEIGYVSGVTSAIQTQLDTKQIKNTNDLYETSFTLTNNQASAANVTGLAFANGSVRSFEALLSVYVTATASKAEEFKLLGVQKASGWDMAVTSNGDDSGIDFTITSAGQVQYTSPSFAGFSAGTMKFRAIATSV